MVPVTIDVHDVALARWTMVRDDPNVDIDLYLARPDRRPGRAEHVGRHRRAHRVRCPPNGTYTLFVHGWSVGATPFEFSSTSGSCRSPRAPATSASRRRPPRRSPAARRQVTASWTGAAAGRSLGAVSHTGPDGLLGLTVVAVDN